ncbi:MAG: type II secretion system protein [Thermodesulfobacteriota bacterium]
MPCDRIRIDRRRTGGFTLLEIVLTLAILGVLGAMAGLGVVQITKGFVFSRDNTETAGKAQLAMLRIIKEFTVVRSVGSGSASAITFTAQHGAATTKTYTLSLSGANLMMNDGGSNDILANRVTGFTLNYYDTYNGSASSTWSPSRRIIEITITVQAADGMTSSFSTRITPRNV